MVDFDIAYSQQKSLALDLKIMLLTGPVLVRQILESQIAWFRRQKTVQSASPFTETPFKPKGKFQRS